MVSSTLPLIVGVDDEPDDIFFLRQLIRKTGLEHRFQPFTNGEAAIVALSPLLTEQPSVDFPLACFFDIKMVGMSGFDLLRWVRSQKALDALPVIMFSSSDDPRDIDAAREIGAQGYLKKFPSITAMRTILDEAKSFAALAEGKKTFLNWSYRFIESAQHGAGASLQLR
jgi:CheY-like chemotaxis protein